MSYKVFPRWPKKDQFLSKIERYKLNKAAKSHQIGITLVLFWWLHHVIREKSKFLVSDLYVRKLPSFSSRLYRVKLNIPKKVLRVTHT